MYYYYILRTSPGGLFLKVSVQAPASGKGGGGGATSLLLSSGTMWFTSSLSDSALSTEEAVDRLSPMLLKYSEGLISPLWFPAPPGKLGGTKGRTLCLLTRLGIPCLSDASSVSAPTRLMIVRSEQDDEL